MSLGDRYRVPPGTKVTLAEYDPNDTAEYTDKKTARKALKQITKRLNELQYLLYAEDKRGLLIVLQGMDASGKDGTIRHGPLPLRDLNTIRPRIEAAEGQGAVAATKPDVVPRSWR